MNRRNLILSLLLAAFAGLAPLTSALQIGGEHLQAILYGKPGTAGVVDVLRSERVTIVTVKVRLPAEVERASVWLAGTPYALDMSSQDGYGKLVLDSRLGHRIPRLQPGMTVGVTSGEDVWLKGILEKVP